MGGALLWWQLLQLEDRLAAYQQQQLHSTDSLRAASLVLPPSQCLADLEGHAKADLPLLPP